MEIFLKSLRIAIKDLHATSRIEDKLVVMEMFKKAEVLTSKFFETSFIFN